MSRTRLPGLIVAASLFLPGASSGQLMMHVLVVDSDGPQGAQTIFPEHPGPGQTPLSCVENGTLPSGIGTLRALAGPVGYDEQVAHAVFAQSSGDHVLASLLVGDHWIDVRAVASAPIGYPVEGLTLLHDDLLGIAYNDEADESVLLSIDPATGVGSMMASTGPGLRFVGLAVTWVGSSERELFGLTLSSTGESAIYHIDEVSGQTTHILDLPGPCDGLGEGPDGLLAAGAELYWVAPDGSSMWTYEPVGGCSMFAPIVAMGGAWDGTPLLESTWGGIKVLSLDHP